MSVEEGILVHEVCRELCGSLSTNTAVWPQLNLDERLDRPGSINRLVMPSLRGSIMKNVFIYKATVSLFIHINHSHSLLLLGGGGYGQYSSG